MGVIENLGQSLIVREQPMEIIHMQGYPSIVWRIAVKTSSNRWSGWRLAWRLAAGSSGWMLGLLGQRLAAGLAGLPVWVGLACWLAGWMPGLLG